MQNTFRRFGGNLSEDEIVIDLVDTIRSTPHLLKEWHEIRKQDLIRYHHSIGRDIRNHYNLWGMRIYSKEHPDAVSMRIMNKVWEKINV